MSYERLLTARRHIDERRFREAIVELHVVLENETKPSQTEETIELLALANFKAAYLTEAERLAPAADLLAAHQRLRAHDPGPFARAPRPDTRRPPGRRPWRWPSERISDSRKTQDVGCGGVRELRTPRRSSRKEDRSFLVARSDVGDHTGSWPTPQGEGNTRPAQLLDLRTLPLAPSPPRCGGELYPLTHTIRVLDLHGSTARTTPTGNVDLLAKWVHTTRSILSGPESKSPTIFTLR